MDAFTLEIITPQRLVFSETIDAVSVPTTTGHITVLAHHMPIFTVLADGEIKITSKGSARYLAIGGGFMEVTSSKVSVLVSRAFHADELNEAEIKKAQESAKAVLARKDKGMEYAAAQAIYRRSLLELKVVRRTRQPRTIPS